MRFGSLATVLALIGGSLLTACGSGGGGSNSGTAQVRLVNASVGYSSLDYAVGGTAVSTAIGYAKAGDYKGVDTGATASQVQTGGTTLASLTPTLAGGSHYSVIAYGWSGALKTTLLLEEETAPTASGTAKLLVLNLAPDAGTVDTYLTASTDTLDAATPTASSVAGGSSSGYLSVNSGTYRLRITAAGARGDLRLDIPSITLDSQKVHTLIITPTQGGKLVNAVLMQQQGAVSNYAATTARARVAAAISGNPQVNVNFSGTSLMDQTVAPQIGEYKSLSAGAGTMTVTINGVAQPVTTPNLAAGGDYTVLVWGTPAAPQTSVISDDNRLPAAGSAKLRLVNGVSNLNAGLSMTMDFSSLASNIQPGSASTPFTAVASTSSTLSVTSPTQGTAVYSITTPIAAGGIYTFFMTGDVTNIIAKPVKEP